MASWVDGWVNLGGRKEASQTLNVVKEFVTKFCQQTLEYRAREQYVNTEGKMFRK